MIALLNTSPTGWTSWRFLSSTTDLEFVQEHAAHIQYLRETAEKETVTASFGMAARTVTWGSVCPIMSLLVLLQLSTFKFFRFLKTKILLQKKNNSN